MSEDQEIVDQATEAESSSEAVSFSAFLESAPPSQLREVTEVADCQSSHPSLHHKLRTPDLRLHCDHDDCKGTRTFRISAGSRDVYKGRASTYLTYTCSNCKSSEKIYSLFVTCRDVNGTTGKVYKFGEYPVFGVPTPPRLLRLFGKDRDLFLKGRRCESQGLGIAAFVYYRRVVESHKNQILDEILRVARLISAPSDMIESLEAAKGEIQFSKAMTAVKNAMPQSLLIRGQNPLSLLHGALSAGLHEETDQHCLQLAHDVRVVLAELAERIGVALKDEAELNSAVSRLVSARSSNKS